jgi:electron transfer flavoprotein beta subunit
VVGPFDENALELALQLKQRHGAAVHAISAGGKLAIAALKKALALQADDAARVDVDTDALDTAGLATLMARVIARIPETKLVLVGRQSGDWDAGQLGPLLAEALGFASATLVKRIEDPDGDAILLVRERDGRSERVRVSLPAVLSITNDPGNQPRVAKVRDILMADRKTIPAYSPADLGLAGAPAPILETMALHRPPSTGRTLELVSGATVQDRASALARRLLDLSGIG